MIPIGSGATDPDPFRETLCGEQNSATKSTRLGFRMDTCLARDQSTPRPLPRRRRQSNSQRGPYVEMRRPPVTTRHIRKPRRAPELAHAASNRMNRDGPLEYTGLVPPPPMQWTDPVVPQGPVRYRPILERP